MHTKIKTGLGLVIILILTITIGVFVWQVQKKDQNPTQPEEQRCTMEAKVCPDGSSVGHTGPKCEFSPCPEIVGIEDKIIITAPKPGEIISSPVTVSGRARGIWFFEGSFPVDIYDDHDLLLGQGYASFIPSYEGEEWMTTEFINFSGSVEFSNPSANSGYILFKKDNPSDLRELDESFKLPIRFLDNSSTSDISNWQTYRNEKYGFEFMYPSNWFLYNASDGKAEIKGPFNIFIQPEKEVTDGIPGPHASALSIQVIYYNGILDDNSITSLESNKSIQFKKEKVIIDGVEGIKVTSICEGVGCGNPDWFVVRNNYLYKFYSQLGNSETFDQILSTFKFTP